MNQMGSTSSHTVLQKDHFAKGPFCKRTILQKAHFAKRQFCKRTILDCFIHHSCLFPNRGFHSLLFLQEFEGWSTHINEVSTTIISPPTSPAQHQHKTTTTTTTMEAQLRQKFFISEDKLIAKGLLPSMFTSCPTIFNHCLSTDLSLSGTHDTKSLSVIMYIYCASHSLSLSLMY